MLHPTPSSSDPAFVGGAQSGAALNRVNTVMCKVSKNVSGT